MTYKYIRFKLPSAHSNDSADVDRLQRNMTNLALKWIGEQLIEWSEQHNAEYILHMRKHAVYVEFLRPSAVSELMLTWKPRAHSTGWTRITVTDTIEDTVNEPYILAEEVGYIADMLSNLDVNAVASTVSSKVMP